MKIVKGIITFILIIILLILEAGIILLFSLRNIKTEETISESIEEIDVQEILKTDDKEEDTINKVYDILGQIKINKGDANIILNDKDFKKVISNFVSTATLHQFNDNIEIKYPTEEDITNVIYNNFDALKESYQLDVNKEDVSKEMIREEVSKNYDTIKSKLDEYIEKMGGKHD